MTTSPATVYVFAWALSAGIFRATVQKIGDYTVTRASNGMRYDVSPRKYTTDPAEAVAGAEAMRKKRIASLRKQIATLEAMTFTAGEKP